MPNGNVPGPNALAAGGAAPPPPTLGAPQSGAFNAADHVENNWQQAQAQHKQLMASQKRMNVARNMLDKLKKKGDQVQVEDVIEGAGTMVGAGFSPQALAQMLAQMPTTGGQALEAWVEQQDQRAQQMDQQLQAKVKASAIHRGITAMASLHIDHIRGSQQKAAGAMPPQPSVGGALAPQGMQGGMGTPSSPQGDEEAPAETGD